MSPENAALLKRADIAKNIERMANRNNMKRINFNDAVNISTPKSCSNRISYDERFNSYGSGSDSDKIPYKKLIAYRPSSFKPKIVTFTNQETKVSKELQIRTIKSQNSNDDSVKYIIDGNPLSEEQNIDANYSKDNFIAFSNQNSIPKKHSYFNKTTKFSYDSSTSSHYYRIHDRGKHSRPSTEKNASISNDFENSQKDSTANYFKKFIIEDEYSDAYSDINQLIDSNNNLNNLISKFPAQERDSLKKNTLSKQSISYQGYKDDKGYSPQRLIDIPLNLKHPHQELKDRNSTSYNGIEPNVDTERSQNRQTRYGTLDSNKAQRQTKIRVFGETHKK